MAFIYCLENRLTGMKYVGQTTRSVKTRFKQHCNASSYIGNALRKYGKDNFSINVLEVCNVDTLTQFEIKHIKSQGSLYPNGYNLIKEGTVNRRHSKISKHKMSKSRIGKKQSIETVNKRMAGVNKKITCLEDGICFMSITEAATYYNIKGKSHISAQARGKYKGKLKGRTFVYGGAVSHLFN